MTSKNQKMTNKEIQKRNVNDVRKLEEMYCNGEVSDLLKKIDEVKEVQVNNIIEYANKHNVPVKWDKDGNPLEFKVKFNPTVVKNYFFKSIMPISCQEPIYNAERLGIVFDYYCDLIAEVNDKIGDFPSSLSSFCKFAGITTNTLRTYKNSNDYNMRIIANKIYDEVSDENITLSQLGKTRERSTIFKMKAQNDLVEQPRTNINVNMEVKPNYDAIQEQINDYKKFIE